MKILIILLDAIGQDKINQETTPFLDSLAQKERLGIHHQVFGFLSIPAAFFTGKTPVETNRFFLFWKKKKPLNHFLSFCPNLLANGLYNLKRVLTGKTFLVKLGNKKLLKNFSLAQDFYYHHPQSLPHKTIFNILREKNIQHLSYDWPYLIRNGKLKYDVFTKSNDKEITSKFLKLARDSEYQILFVHLYQLDRLGHKFGPDSGEYAKHLKQVDLLVKEIFDFLVAPKDRFLIWSDHGMLPVKKTINLEKILPLQKDYLYFFDSTMARFWFNNDKVKRKVLSILKNIPEGHLLSDQEKRNFQINFKHSKYGEEIFLCDPGVLILPNFFQKKPVKGMHGYNLRGAEEKGFFISNFISRKTIKTTEFFKEVIKELGA